MGAVSSVAIVGGGVGGFTTARELRRRGFDGAITIVDPEGVPYDRPPLSKQYLTGEYDAARLGFVEPGWYAASDITLVTDRADRVLAAEGAVLLDSGHTLAADALVLATGGVPRHLPVPGGDTEGVLVLRTREDAERLRDRLRAGGSLAIVGAGLVGAEVASTAARLGMATTLIDPVPVPLVPAVGPDLARVLHEMHAAAGIDTVTAAVSHVARRGPRFELELDGGPAVGGRRLEADTVLVAVGIEPDMTLAESAALDIDNGVLVDDRQRTTNPAIYAVGDSARTRRPDGALVRRHEHWESAMHGGQTAAAAIIGDKPPTHGAPWFWSDRHGVHVEGVGQMTGTGRDVVRVVDGVPQMAFRVTDEGLVAGCAAIDGGVGVRAARRIIDRRIRVDPAQLADPTIGLKKLAT